MAEINLPLGPIHTPPHHAIRHDPGEGEQARRAAIAQSLSRVELGAYDEAIAEWLAGLDNTTVATICSWLARAKEVDAARVDLTRQALAGLEHAGWIAGRAAAELRRTLGDDQ